MIEGLRNIENPKTDDLAFAWSALWLKTNYNGFQKTGHMYEKVCSLYLSSRPTSRHYPFFFSTLLGILRNFFIYFFLNCSTARFWSERAEMAVNTQLKLASGGPTDTAWFCCICTVIKLGLMILKISSQRQRRKNVLWYRWREWRMYFHCQKCKRSNKWVISKITVLIIHV